jgi:hypothetical protein
MGADGEVARAAAGEGVGRAEEDAGVSGAGLGFQGCRGARGTGAGAASLSLFWNMAIRAANEPRRMSAISVSVDIKSM